MKKNENYPKYVHAMHLLDEGKTINYVSMHLKMGRRTLILMRQRYMKGGELALLMPTYQPQMDLKRKVEIVTDIVQNDLSLSEASLKYDIHQERLRRWLRVYEQFGESGLDKRRTNAMKKKRQRAEAELDELEMLRKRNEYLEAENALLKKVKALVEEREARLRAIGRKPSKD
jgi:transposase-like protein